MLRTLSENDWCPRVRYPIYGSRPEPNRLFILGADDPEMRAMKELLALAGQKWEQATHQSQPVSPGTSYQADTPIGKADHYIFIECCPKFGYDVCRTTYTVIDHHRPGDPGFDLPAEKYWEAASIGQLTRYLSGVVSNWTMKKIEARERWDRYTAALDHSNFAACAGLCPGIDPIVARRKVCKMIAKSHGTKCSEVRTRIRSWLQRIEEGDFSQTKLNEAVLLDARDVRLPPGYSLEFLTLREACFMLKKSFMVRYRDRPDEREKLVVILTKSPELIKYFVDEWVPAHGLVDPYWSESRMYAGAYVPEAVQ